MSTAIQVLRETGSVRRLIGEDRIQVELSRKAECGKCGACSVAADGMMLIEAINRAHAKLGQRVVVEIQEGEVIRAASIVYLVPVTFLLIGVLIGTGVAELLNAGEIAGAIQAVFAFGMFFGSFILVRRMGQRYEREECLPVVTEIIEQ